jgi:hypothetical protein
VCDSSIAQFWRLSLYFSTQRSLQKCWYEEDIDCGLWGSIIPEPSEQIWSNVPLRWILFGLTTPSRKDVIRGNRNHLKGA